MVHLDFFFLLYKLVVLFKNKAREERPALASFPLSVRLSEDPQQ